MQDYWAPRQCLREPIPDIFIAAELLNKATDAHLSQDRSAALAFIRKANMPSVRAWTESLWGRKKNNPDQERYLRYREILGAPLSKPKDQRIPKRMPSSTEKIRLIERYGRHCVFCGIPLIRDRVRMAFNLAYPEAEVWGGTNATQHAAFQCMWLQFDHIVPHAHGGDNSIDNVVVTCAPCNYGRWDATLEEVGLLDPRTRPVKKTPWDGLERFLKGTTVSKQSETATGIAGGIGLDNDGNFFEWPLGMEGIYRVIADDGHVTYRDMKGGFYDADGNQIEDPGN